MELRQQVTLSQNAILKILLDHVKRAGLRISETSAQVQRDGSFFALTMTEDEIYFADTKALLEKPLQSLELKSAGLKKKLIDRKSEDAIIASLLEKPFPGRVDLMGEFRKRENYLERSLYSNEYNKRNKLKKEEEAILIKALGDLGINIKPREKEAFKD